MKKKKHNKPSLTVTTSYITSADPMKSLFIWEYGLTYLIFSKAEKKLILK